MLLLLSNIIFVVPGILWCDTPGIMAYHAAVARKEQGFRVRLPGGWERGDHVGQQHGVQGE